MERDNEEIDVYNDPEKLEEADEIDEIEEGFMKGYEEDINEAICSNCKKTLVSQDFIEEKLGDTTYRFCTKECADNFELRNEHL